jgi:dihydroorotate dehydrogenase (NAD+) catalytic subunit
LRTLGTSVVVSVAGRTEDDFVSLAERVGGEAGVAAIELNLSCPNVSGGIDFGTNAESCRKVVAAARAKTDAAILAKLTPNVTRIDEVAQGAADGGADAVCLINTVLGIAVDWRGRKPMLGNGMGGLSGPAIKPIALRCVHQVATAVEIPIIGIGGIANIDDVMQFLVTGASAVQIGTANYYDPHVSTRLIDQLPAALAELHAESVADCVGTLQT